MFLRVKHIRSEMMYQRIIVPVDNSETSNQALDEAIKLAKDSGAALVLAHIVEQPSYSVRSRAQLTGSAVMTTEMQIGQAIMKTAVQHARTKGLEPEEVVMETEGEPIATALLSVAHSCHAELIVMGTHGRSGIGHLLMGSVAEGTLRASDLPILMISSKKSKA
jgi:nucleotide-binding universal stress UspA family protein